MTEISKALEGKRIAILIPCYNEEKTVAKVVSDFRRQLPGADIYVYDNNSTDRTAEEALAAGAILRRETRQGKGFVVRRMFSEVEADYYVMADGDDTYPAEHVAQLLEPLVSGRAHLSVGTRLEEHDAESFRPMHKFGNKLIRTTINVFFHAKLSDVLSGYRAFDREIVKSLPLLSGGFEIETEMTIQALDKGYLIAEIPMPYRSRPAGSLSKLNTYRDGALVMTTIFRIFKDYRPLLFFTLFSAFFLLLGLALGMLPVMEFAETGVVRRVPTAFLAASLVLLSFVSFTAGLILDSMKRRDIETYSLLAEIYKKLG